MFELPPGWPSVNTEWPEAPADGAGEEPGSVRVFRVDNPERRFDRPTGWMIAGAAVIDAIEIGVAVLVIALASLALAAEGDPPAEDAPPAEDTPREAPQP